MTLQAQKNTETTKFTPPFKRLNEKEVLDCLTHGWTGRATFIKAAQPPKETGKYARMAYDMASKRSFVSAIVYPAEGKIYRQVDYSVVAGLTKKGLVTVSYLSECEANFHLNIEVKA